MSNILYLGCRERAAYLRTAIAPIGGYVYTPVTMFDTLAMVVNFWPDRILLDASAVPDLVDQVRENLADIGIESIIVYSDQDVTSALTDLCPTLEMPCENVTA